MKKMKEATTIYRLPLRQLKTALKKKLGKRLRSQLLSFNLKRHWKPWLLVVQQSPWWLLPLLRCCWMHLGVQCWQLNSSLKHLWNLNVNWRLPQRHGITNSWSKRRLCNYSFLQFGPAISTRNGDFLKIQSCILDPLALKFFYSLLIITIAYETRIKEENFALIS